MNLHIETCYGNVFKIPKKLVNMFKTFVRKTRSAVRMEETLCSFFLKIKQD